MSKFRHLADVPLLLHLWTPVEKRVAKGMVMAPRQEAELMVRTVERILQTSETQYISLQKDTVARISEMDFNALRLFECEHPELYTRDTRDNIMG